MTNTHMASAMAMSNDGGPDDLPRTLRREREAREREARDREARERSGTTLQAAPPSYPAADPMPHDWSDDGQPAVVTALRIPFFRLMLFFVKAVFAAIPALLILGAILWGAGFVLKSHFPWLVQMQILIKFPS